MMSDEKKLNFKEELLITLYFSHENKSNITRLVKLLFLYEEIFDINLKKELKFVPYTYGPWAQNFETLMTPFILADLVSLKTKNNMKQYSYSKEKRIRIRDLIENKYLEKSQYKTQINLIKFLTQKYEDQRLDELIQLVYFLKPNFTEKSEIKEKILRKSTEFNQNFLISLFEESAVQYLQKITKFTEGILKFFNFPDEKSAESKFFSNLFQRINEYFSIPTNYQSESLLRYLYNFENQTKYKYLKWSLISLFSMFEISWDESFYRNLYLFILKSIQLEWPLTKDSFTIFNNLVIELKNNNNLSSFFGEVPELTEKERILTVKLTEDLKTIETIELKKDISLAEPVKRKTKREKPIKIFSSYEDYNDKEDEKENTIFEESYAVSE